MAFTQSEVFIQSSRIKDLDNQAMFSSERKDEWLLLTNSWKNLDHPFFIFLKNLLDQKTLNIQEAVGDNFSWENLAELLGIKFYGNKPDEVVFATASARKIVTVLVSWLEIDVPFSPRDYDLFLDRAVPNGNGAKKGKNILFSLDGVLFCSHDSEGEGDGNNPNIEALKKVEWLSKQSEYNEKHIWFFSTDTVDFIDKDRDGSFTKGEGLGKPPGEKEYLWLKEKFPNLSEEALLWIFKFLIFLPHLGKKIISHNAVGLLDLAANGDVNAMGVLVVTLESEITLLKLLKMKPKIDKGGAGGGSQVFYKVKKLNEIFKIIGAPGEEIKNLLITYAKGSLPDNGVWKDESEIEWEPTNGGEKETNLPNDEETIVFSAT